MKKDWKYISYLAILVAIFLVVQLSRSKQFDWRVTYASADTNPYGTIALQTLLRKSGYAVNNSYKTFYELKDSAGAETALFAVARSMSVGTEDTKALLAHVAKGGQALLLGDYFYGKLADTLGISVYDNLFKGEELFPNKDTLNLHLVNTSFDTLSSFPVRTDHIHTHFGKVDSVQATVLVRNEANQAVAIRVQHGKGRLVLACTPMVLTNIHLLSANNNELVSSLFASLGKREILRTEFYHLGRMEVGTPLRFVLRNETLRWAYYLSIALVITFIFFEAKRKQRIIPIIKPLTNTTLEFVATIGNLYYQRADHKNIAEKKIAFFWDRVRSHYFLNINPGHEGFAEALAKKTGHSLDVVRDLLSQFDAVHRSKQIDAARLKRLSDTIIDFWKKK